MKNTFVQACLVTMWASVSMTGFPPKSHADAAEKGLVVHEWGVMWVGHYQGGPALGATDAYLQSLPEFVLRNEEVSPTTVNQQLLNVYKPVIHFYGQDGQQVQVTVKMPDGIPVVYYPMPKIERTTSIEVGGGRRLHNSQSYTGAITWDFKLSEKNPGTLARAPDGHWWHDARDIPSDYLTMADGSATERFLFYEGTTRRQPLVTASVTEGTITVTNNDKIPSSPIIILINDNGEIRGCNLAAVDPGKQRSLESGDFSPWDEKAVFSHCEDQWVACGMTREEARGIVATWKPELLNTRGFLMISKIPDSVYEQIYPISINPPPAELKRACMVFDTLPNQDARRAWLPKLAEHGRDTIRKLGDTNYIERMKARAVLVETGELMLPFVAEALADGRAEGNPDLKMLLEQLQGVLAESPVCVKSTTPQTPNANNAGFIPEGVPLIIPPGAGFERRLFDR